MANVLARRPFVTTRILYLSDAGDTVRPTSVATQKTDQHVACVSAAHYTLKRLASLETLLPLAKSCPKLPR